MVPPPASLFAGNPLDRAGNERRDPAWVTAQQKSPDARLLILRKGQPAIDTTDATPRLLWRGATAFDALPEGTERVLLGLRDGRPHWAADLSLADETVFTDGEHRDLRSAAFSLAPDEAAIAGVARWLLDWHRRHQYCARFGHKTISSEGGFKRLNPETGTEHFPRHDPVAIVLPLYGDQVCLGRSPHFPEGMVSAFAGFVEAGETMEECAARELHEEVGLVVSSMNYLCSQPWPFPSSLMFGFHAVVESPSLRPDPAEIEMARWFSREEAAALLNGKDENGFFAPPARTVAGQLLQAWLAR